VPVSLSFRGASFCGTCFMQTRIFKVQFPHGLFVTGSINDAAARE
jgi:hypothetical protein